MPSNGILGQAVFEGHFVLTVALAEVRPGALKPQTLTCELRHRGHIQPCVWFCVPDPPQRGQDAPGKVAGMQESTQTDHKHPQHQPHRAALHIPLHPSRQEQVDLWLLQLLPGLSRVSVSGTAGQNRKRKCGGGEVAGGAAAEGTKLLQVGVETGSEPQEVPCLVFFHAPHPHVLSCPAPLPAWAQNNSQGWH